MINTPETRALKQNTVKTGTVGKTKKNRGGLFKIFGGTNVSIHYMNFAFHLFDLSITVLCDFYFFFSVLCCLLFCIDAVNV